MRRAVALSAATAALMTVGGGVSAAAPPERETITLTCGGEVFDVVVNGNGAFTPGRAVDSNKVLVPISFGDFTFHAKLPDGTVITDSEPGVVDSKGKGNVAKHNPRPTVTCTFEDSLVLKAPEEGFPAGTVLTFGGTVTGFLVGR